MRAALGELLGCTPLSHLSLKANKFETTEIQDAFRMMSVQANLESLNLSHCVSSRDESRAFV